MATQATYNYSLDARVMSRKGQVQAADKLHKQQQQARIASEEKTQAEHEEPEESGNISRIQHLARMKAERQENNKSKTRRGPYRRRWTNMVLRSAWFNLYLVFPFLYICVHKVMHRIMPRKFGVLGEEWMPPAVAAANTKGQNTVGLLPLIENIIFWAIFFLLLFIFALVLAIAIMIIDALEGVLGFVFNFFI